MNFNLVSLKSSVVELAEKCRQLTKLRISLRDRRRGGEEDPFWVWDDGRPVRLPDVVMKRRTRRYCSRYHQLAYAFARGRAFRRTEPKGSVPSARVICEVLLEHVVGEHPKEAIAILRKSLLESLDEWLKAPATVLPLPAPKDSGLSTASAA